MALIKACKMESFVSNPANGLYTVNTGALATYTITGTNIKYVDARGSNVAYTDGVYAAGLYNAVAFVDSNYKYPTSGNVHISAASSTSVTVVMQGGGCSNAQFFIVGDDITITHT